MPLVDGLPDTEGIADRQHEIADFHRIGIGDGQDWEGFALGLNLQYRKIDPVVLQHHRAGEFAAIRQGDLDVVSAVDDVVRW